MLRLETILAPVDFSDMSHAAAEHAAMLARRFDAKLLLAYVRPPADLYGPAAAVAVGHTERDLEQIRLAETKLRGWAEAVCPRGDAQPLLATGDPARQLRALAENNAVDLVVLATHGHGGFRRFLIGSLTQKLLHDLVCPILTGVHMECPQAFPDKPYERVACAVGLREKEHSAQALLWASEFAGRINAKLIAVHAAPTLSYPVFAGGPTPVLLFPEQARREIVQQRESLLTDLLDELHVEAKVHVDAQQPADYVERVMRETGSDLLIVGRSVRHGVFGGPHGDAYSIIRRSPAPVLSVCPRGARVRD